MRLAIWRLPRSVALTRPSGRIILAPPRRLVGCSRDERSRDLRLHAPLLRKTGTDTLSADPAGYLPNRLATPDERVELCATVVNRVVLKSGRHPEDDTTATR
jgi:hypothetical protein